MQDGPAPASAGRRRAFAVALVTVAAWVGQPAASAAPSTEERALLKTEDALFAADVNHDVGAIRRGFADEAIFVHANGMTQTKADYIAATEHPAFPIKSIDTENRVVRIFGDVGVIRGVKRLVAGDMHLSGSYLSVYVKRDGRWQLLDQQSAPAPRPPEAK